LWKAMGAEFEAHAAATMVNQAVALAGTGDRRGAVQLLREALVLNRRALGIRHLRTLVNVNMLAADFAIVNEMDAAEALYLEALPIERELYPDDIQLARTLEGLSNILLRRGRAREALPQADEALSLAIRVAGEGSLEAALAYSNAAAVHRALGNTERALPLLRKSYAYYRNAVGPEHPRTAMTLSQIGQVLMDDGKLGLAGEALQDAIRSIEKSCPGCVAELSIAHANLGALRLKQKRYREADEALTRSVEMALNISPHPGAEVAGILEALATVKEKERQHASAVQLNEHARAIRAYR
jgi:tetratricopeptide (TPR) repeat protein